MLLFWFGSYKQFPNNSYVSLCDIIFMYNHKYKASQILTFWPSFKLLWSCRLLNVDGTDFKGFAAPINKAAWSAICDLWWRTLFFDCNIFYFDWIKSSWYGRQAFCSCSFLWYLSRMFYNKKYLVTPYVSRSELVSLNWKRHFDILPDKLGMDIAPYYNKGYICSNTNKILEEA